MNGATVTTNITFHRDDWKALKTVAMEQGISMAEFVRRLTVNGFTPEFEEEVLKAAAEPIEKEFVWNGKGSFTDFVLKAGKKRYRD